MAVGRVVPHHVPDDRPIANLHHWLRDRLGILPHPDTEAAAEQDHLHDVLQSRGFGQRLMFFDESALASGRRRPAASRASAARAITLKGISARSATSSRVWLPSDWFSTQRRACSTSVASATPPSARYRPAAPELRLSLRAGVQVGPVALEDVDDRQELGQAVLQELRLHEIEVVGGGVVLGKPSVRRARQAADGQVEAGRAVLPLVVAVRREVHDAVRRSTVAQHVLHRAVDLGIAGAAPLVRGRAGVADAREHQAVPDP